YSSGACTRSRCWCFPPTAWPGRTTIWRAWAGCRSRKRTRAASPSSRGATGVSATRWSRTSTRAIWRRWRRRSTAATDLGAIHGPPSPPPTFTGQEVAMSFDRDRRDILKLMGVGGVVFASRLAGAATGRRRKSDAGAESEFFFLQLSDTHWGYSGVSNPEAD